MKTYQLNLTFDQINCLIHFGIIPGIKKTEEELKESSGEFTTHFYTETQNNLKSAVESIRTQMEEQGSHV